MSEGSARELRPVRADDVYLDPDPRERAEERFEGAAAIAELLAEPPSMVWWLHASELLKSASVAVLASEFGARADRREVQAALDPDPEYHDFSAASADGDAFQFDFVADTGDGFEATYAVAWAVANGAVAWYEGDLERAAPANDSAFVLLGGDQVYPAASRDNYESRFVRPWTAALPSAPKAKEAHRPFLFAIPGNHDWYDGLTSFLRLFCQGRRIGRWRTRQQRSYFALRLPGHWWVLGLDIQLHGDIDEPQLGYFRSVSEQFERGDRVIICTPEPCWFDGKEKYRNLAYFQRSIVEECGGRVAAVLTGDLHHFAVYQEASGTGPRDLHVTAGGGGASLSPTHTLPARVELGGGRPDLVQATSKEGTPLVYPSAQASIGELANRGAAALGTELEANARAEAARKAWFPLWKLSPTLSVTIGCLWAVSALIGSVPALLVVVALLVVAVGFARARAERHTGAGPASPTVATRITGHASLQAGAGASIGLALGLLLPTPWVPAIAAALALVLGTTIGAHWFWSFLAGGGQDELNILYSGLAIPRYKHFLRCRIEGDRLEIIPVGVETLPVSRWRARAEDHAIPDPLIVPASAPPRCSLLFDPIVVDMSVEQPVAGGVPGLAGGDDQ
jgi:hypothetical protein